jgi:hypothetical protein
VDTDVTEGNNENNHNENTSAFGRINYCNSKANTPQQHAHFPQQLTAGLTACNKRTCSGLTVYIPLFITD